MNEDYLLYLLIRNFSSQPQDKLTEQQLKSLLQAQQRLPEHQFQQISEQAKRTRKLRKQLPQQEQDRIRAQENAQFLAIDNPQIQPQPDNSKQLQQEIRTLTARVNTLQTENQQLKSNLAKFKIIEGNERNLQLDLEKEREANIDSTRKVQSLAQQLNKYKEFAYNLAQFEKVPDDDLPTLYTKITKTINSSARKITGAKQLIPDILTLKTQISDLRNFCTLNISTLEIDQIVQKALQIQSKKAHFSQNQINFCKIYINSSQNSHPEVIDSFDEIVEISQINNFISQRTHNLLSTDRVVFVFLQENALQDLQNCIKTMLFKPCVVSSFCLIDKKLSDSFQAGKEISEFGDLLKVELSAQMELLKVLNLIFKKTRAADQVGVIFWLNGVQQSLFLCGGFGMEIQRFLAGERIGVFKLVDCGIQENWVFVGENGYD